MSGFEIERKFLVKKGSDFKRQAFASSHVQQGYIPCETATVRIRLRDDEAFLTIKGKPVDGGLTRYEFEKNITREEAENLLKICRGGVIDKHRYLVKSHDGHHTFEIDEFHGENDGLVMAEVELSRPDEPFEKPDFIGPEVTGDRRFYNKHMLRYPFSLWRESLPEAYR
ncbi:MAG: CYTH domain-containing protein [Prevotella sp.]|nr:CYTH domain-containing protein [Prevotella sp.]